MKRKKLFTLLLTALLFSAAGCGGNNEETPPDHQQEDNVTTGNFETEDVKLINELYDEEDLELINAIQGHITHLDHGGTFPVLVANNKFYFEDYGSLKEMETLPEEPDDILYFDNMEIGENLLYFKDNTVSLYPINDEYGIQFSNIEFNKDTDFVAEIGLSSYFMIVRKVSDGYNIQYYEMNEETEEFELNNEAMIEEIMTSDYTPLDVKEIVVLPSYQYGYCIYVITNNNEAYWIDTINHRGSMTALSSAPYFTNVSRIFAPADVGNYLTLPVYSKIDDSSALYSGAPGADLFETSDNFEISFLIPEGHTTDEVEDIIRVSEHLVFVFDNGDVYTIDELEEEEKTSYEMEKLEDVSQLNKEDKILDMAGASTMDDNLYILMSDGNLYYQSLDE